MTNAITVQVGRKQVEMELVAEYEVGPASAREMKANGWIAWTGAAKTAKGSKLHMIYRSARTQKYVSVVTI
jgi:hypothetical protein